MKQKLLQSQIIEILNDRTNRSNKNDGDDNNNII